MGDISFTVELDETADPEKQSGSEPDSGVSAPEPAAGKSPPAVISRAAAKEEAVFTVSRLTRQIRSLLEEALPTVAVEGEISNFKAAASGHLYFNLKDSSAQIRCVMFRSAAQSMRFDPEDGMQVVLRGRVSVYEARGEYQIQALTLDPKGVGALQVAFEQLKRRLESEGLFAESAKQPLPYLPRCIGIVTSPQGAAIRDMLTVLQRRFPGMPVLIHPATVQGDQAAAEIAAAIGELNRRGLAQQIDVIIVGRGGGSVEDLWAFNEEAVARAIYGSRIPIVSAVGHEVDFTIADFVADMRAPTPSAAAELVVPPRDDLMATVADRRERLFGRLQSELRLKLERWTHFHARLGTPQLLLEQAAQRVDDLQERIALAGNGLVAQAAVRHRHAGDRLGVLRPDRMAHLYRGVIDGLDARLRPALRRHVAAQRERLSATMDLLESLSPLTVMKRGYGAVLDEAGNAVRSTKETRLGQLLTLHLRDGRLTAAVREIDPDAADDGNHER